MSRRHMLHEPVVVRDLYEVSDKYDGAVLVLFFVTLHGYINALLYVASGEIWGQVRCHDNGSIG